MGRKNPPHWFNTRLFFPITPYSNPCKSKKNGQCNSKLGCHLGDPTQQRHPDSTGLSPAFRTELFFSFNFKSKVERRKGCYLRYLKGFMVCRHHLRQPLDMLMKDPENKNKFHEGREQTALLRDQAQLL